MTKKLAYCISIVLFFFSMHLYCDRYYWETPTRMTVKNTQFLHSASGGGKSIAVWQEVVPESDSKGVVYVSLSVYSSGGWFTNERITPAIPYTVNVPSITSCTVGNDGSILIASLNEKTKLVIYKSKDNGHSFEATEIELDANDYSSPYITTTSKGGYLLFLSKGFDEKFSLLTTFSDDGVEWSELKPFISSSISDRVFLPSHAVSLARKSSDLIIFQALVTVNERKSYQLFSTYSTDGCKTFSFPQQITVDGDFQNERPDIRPLYGHNEFILVWERNRNRSANVGVCSMFLNNNGLATSPVAEIFNVAGKSINPKILVINNNPIVCWTHENEGRSAVYIYDYETAETLRVRSVSGTMLFARPYNIAGNLELLWQEGQDVKHIMQIKPDNFVQRPSLIGKVESQKKDKKKLSVKINFPFDSSGIAGYSYTWSKDAPPQYVEEEIKKFPSENNLTFEPEEDGDWYVGVRVADYAGNWSAISVTSCSVDTTPPMPPKFLDLNLDPNGFCVSNNLKIEWLTPEKDEAGRVEGQIRGYTWKIESLNLNSLYQEFIKECKEKEEEVTDEALQEYLEAKVSIKSSLPAFTRTRANYLDLRNYDNGIYCLAVSAIDEVGNIGSPSLKFFALNKYIAYTVINNINVKKDVDGSFSLTLSGRGFKESGDVTNIFIDKDGKAPYDLTLNKGDFSIITDRLISQIHIDDLEEGNYRIGLMHPTRGLYFTSEYITVDEMGTIKFGNYEYSYKHKWQIESDGYSLFNFNFYVRAALLCLFLVVLTLYVVGVTKVIKEYKSLQIEMALLLKGDDMSKEDKKKKSNEIKTRGFGLRFKLVLFTVMLVISIILLLAIPLLSHFSKTQKDLLADSLVSKTETVLESIVSSSRSYLREKNILELAFLTNQANDIDDIIFATITSQQQDGKKEGYNFVWASSDQNILKHINTDTLMLGESHLEGYTEEDLNETLTNLNQEAIEYVGKASRLVGELNQQALNFVTRQDEQGREKRDEIQATIRETEGYITQRLKGLSNSAMGSYPVFDSNNLSRERLEYLFYKPILYRQSQEDDSFVHGIVYLKVSIENLLNAVEKKQQEVIAITLTISFIALLAGILGAWILASIITKPLKELAIHVAMIRDTEDKEKLSGKSMQIKQKDEVGLLAEIINELTDNLSKSAATTKDVTVGKEIQKMFIPLDTDSTGRKLISGKTVEDNVEFFGYYEGAKGVSGDYFDYIKLSDRYYAIIKCDVSGKGVPASLIMVEVATLFANYFKDWTFKKNGFNMSGIVSRINDAIETRGFKGRFAAFTLCILDSMTGATYFCNAGDNIINIYDASEKKMKEITLKETAAAGVFPTMLVDMKGGFPVERIDIKSGDILFLYTDGIEEAKRMFRDEKLQVIVCNEKGLSEGDWHETHTVGQDGEEMGKDRVNAIIEAVFAKKKFILKKMHNPIPDEIFEFDFTTCEGTIEEAILALVSVEKIFRLYQDPSATNFDHVIVDKKVDLFLNKHFLQYPTYCLHREPHPEYDEYLYYTNIRQDEQYDDLTILAVKKK
ncbi:MAG: SpoIIE family protein phosphatase [Treponema sp.]